MKARRLASLFAVLASLAGPASAHDLWIGVQSGANGPEAIVRYGHPGHFEGAAAAKLLEMSARGADGSSRNLSPALGTGDHVPSLIAPVSLQNDGALLSASYDNGFWTRTADGAYRNAAKPMVPGGQESQWSLKFAKAITANGAPWGQTVGHTLELVPTSDPFADGRELRLKVLYKGQPLAGVEIKQLSDLNADGKALSVGQTGADGTLVVPHKSGSDYLSAAYKVPSSQPALADVDSFSATLSIGSGQALTQ